MSGFSVKYKSLDSKISFFKNKDYLCELQILVDNKIHTTITSNYNNVCDQLSEISISNHKEFILKFK